ncbi:hypothetical protein N8737_01060 [Verrucomicrobia bacterium]|jgi:hypothetical protein|nr:hypothetical protein [Verrucomicrobiota bacterium]
MTVLVAAPTVAEGQAYCSLRDPNRIVQELFPEATGFRSFLRKVTRADARTLKADLALDFDPREFTTHTLYAVLQDNKILGYVQSRTEPVEWGLAEIIWVLDSDLNLAAFRFQRCRSRWKEEVEEDSLQTQLKGLSEIELLELWKTKGSKWFRREANLPDSADKLIDAVIKSGLKATGLARIVWGDDITNIRDSLASAEGQ